MIGRRAAVGLTLLCALLFSAFAAQSAMAVKGTTAFTCVPEKGGPFKEAHCNGGSGTGEFSHVEIKQDETTIFHGTNNKTSADTTTHTTQILKSNIAGVEIEISCTKVFAHGHITNKLDTETKEHWIHGQLITLHYTECKVTKPVGQECKIPGETIEAKEITATTTGKGDNITFVPEKETEGKKTFVIITLEGCKTKGLNGKFPVVGSVTAQTEGATITLSESGVTATKELTFGGQPAGLEGKITISQAAETAETGKTGNPISVTTKET